MNSSPNSAIRDALWFLNLLKPYSKKAVHAGCWMMAGVLLRLPLPILTMYVIDNVLAGHQLSTLNLVCAGLIVILLMQTVSALFQNYLLLSFREIAVADLQNRLFLHIERLPVPFFSEQHTGYLMSRVSDASSAGGLMAETILDFFRESLTMVVGIVLIMEIHLKLALMSMLLLPFFVYSINFFGKKVRVLAKLVREKEAIVSQSLQEKLAAISIIKAFVTEEEESQKLGEQLRDRASTSIRSGLWAAIAGIVSSAVGSLAPVIVLWYGGSEVIHGRLTLGQLVAFNAFLGYLFGPTQRLLGLNTTIQQAIGAIQRMREVFDWREEIAADKNSIVLQNPQGRIRFSSVAFSYGGPKNTLQDIDFEVEPGKITALVGKSGAGKTTIVNLIPRFLDPQSGIITLDGIDIQDIPLRILRRQIGMVSQEPILFDTTIAGNVSYGMPGVKSERIIEACRAANADEFISSLPQQYDTRVGERGIRLSTGQKQRLAIARAILRDPKILIFDEATSSIDSVSENLIQDSLEKISKRCATLIIAHRFSTILCADLIVVLHEGRIAGKGNHKDLYVSNPAYRELCDEQLRNFSARQADVQITVDNL